jgi:cytochrome P450 family 110
MTTPATTLPPGPRAPSVVNLARWVWRPFDLLEECQRRYGDAFTVSLPGMPPNVVFSDPDATRDLFTAPVDDVRVGEIAGVLAPILGRRSVMLIDGEAHRRERRRMLPPFRAHAVRTYGPAIQRAAREMVSSWRPGQRLEVMPAMQRVSLDLIVRITLAPRDDARIAHVVERFLELGTSPLATAILWIVPGELTGRLIYEPVRRRAWGTRPFSRLPWAPIVDAQDAMDEVIYDEIAARRRGAYGGSEDLLTQLMAARDEDGSPMSDGELRDQVVTMLLAGHETTATTLSWTIGYLLEDPELWARLRERLAARANDRGELQIDELTEDPWLDAVLREAMRLSPVALTVGRHLRAPMKLGRWELPAGVNAFACAHLIQRRPDLFDEPESFRPERWIDAKQNPYAFFPFGGGARRCLGMALAYYEMKIILAEILARADLERALPRAPRPVRKSVTFAPERGLPVVVRRVLSPSPPTTNPQRECRP